MIPIDTATIFFSICLTMCLLPCAELIVIFSQSTLQGRMAGIAVTLGICTGLLAQVIAMAFGITAIIQTSESVFTGLKIVGTFYLFFLAWQAFTQPLHLCQEGVKQKTLMALYGQGVTMNISNPMNPMFMLVFLPPFVSYEQGGVLSQLLQLGSLLILAVLVVYCTFSFLAATLGRRWLQSARVRRSLQLGSGTTIAGFAVYLAMAKPLLP